MAWLSHIYQDDGYCKRHGNEWCNLCWPGLSVNSAFTVDIRVTRTGDPQAKDTAFAAQARFDRKKPGEQVRDIMKYGPTPEDAARNLVTSAEFLAATREFTLKGIPDAITKQYG